jgi:hypothetical protein
MRTCGMMGEIVGKAAWIAVHHETSPRGVYEKHLPLLQELMKQPGAMRRASLDGQLAPPPGAKPPAPTVAGINPTTLEGIVIDDDAAELTGNWENTGSLTGFVGDGYRYSTDAKATARFPFTVKQSGVYEVRVAWQPHTNRAKAASLIVRTAAGEETFTLDQTKPAQGEEGFHRLGQFRLAANETAAVLFRVAEARGAVHIDAVQVVPIP